MRPALPSSPVEIKHDSPPFLHVWRNPDRNSFFFRMMLLNGLFLFPPSRSPRLHSLDALRGLDMLIILGLDALVLLLASRNPESAFLQEAARQMTHARWEGLHLYDLVFPVFVFISGVSMSFSLGKLHQRERFLRPRASPSLETGSRPGFSGATGQWNAYLDGKHALCLRSGADWFFLRHCRNLHPAVPPDGSGCLCGGVHPGPHYPAPVHLRQLHAGTAPSTHG